MKSISLLCLLLFAFAVNSQDLSYKIQDIDSIVESKLEDKHPGLGVGILMDGKIIFTKYKGLSNLQHQIAFNKDTRSNIASTAKQFTALMILELSQKGSLDLDDDIRVHLPQLYKNVNTKIRVRHLLNHTSGIRDYVELLDLEGNVWWQRFGLDNDDILALLEKQNSLGFSPGLKYSYSNSNYIVLTKIIEKISNQSFNDYSKAFFEKLGMKETTFVERYMGVIPNRANPYSDWGRGEWWEVPTVTKTNGEGFLFTTLNDQLIFEQLVQNAIKESNQLLIASQKPIPNSEITSYGFGLELKDQLGRPSVFHSGGTYGFHAHVDRYPDDKLSIFILSNNGNISSNLIAKEIARVLLPESNSKAAYNSRFYEKPKDNTNISILGTYSYPNENSIVQIIEEEGKTYWKEKNFTVEMFSEGLNKYAFTNNPKLKVVCYQDEIVEYYISGKTMVYKKQKETKVTSSDLNALVGTYYNEELDVSLEMKRVENDSLKLKLSDDNFNDVILYNKEFIAAGNYFLKIQYDNFNRVNQVLLTHGRALNIPFKKKTNLKFQPKIETENGSIQVTTIGSRNGDASDILLTKNYPNGNEIWSKQFGGKNYDKASSILETDDGYLIIGSTSSYGKGNYDMFVLKTDKKGNKLWQNTYGDFYNEYGYSAEKTDSGYIVKGTIQKCSSNTDVFNRTCTNNVWFVTIDNDGNEIANQILEKIN